MGTQPLPKKGRSPQFLAHVYCGQTAAWIKMPLGTEVGCNIVLDGDPAPPALKGYSSPIFGQCIVRCGQTAGWTKMPLATEVGIGPGDFVFDGDAATPRKRAHPPHPIFDSCLLWPKGWMDEDATWYGSKLQPRPHIVLDGVPALHKRGTAPLSFRPMCIVATVAHLSYC